MNRQWEQLGGTDEEECVRLARTLGATKNLLPTGGGSVSFKHQEQNIFGENEPALTLSAQGTSLTTLDGNGLTTLWQARLEKAFGVAGLTGGDLAELLASSKVHPQAPDAVIKGLLHAAIPERVVVIIRPEAVLAISSVKDARSLVENVFKGRVAWVPFYSDALMAAQAVRKAWKTGVSGVVMQHNGLIVAGPDFTAVYERAVVLVELAESYLIQQKAWDVMPISASPVQAVKEDLAQQRKRISEMVGRPVILRLCSDPWLTEMAMRGEVEPTLLAHLVPEDIPLLGLCPYNDQEPEAYLSACRERLGDQIAMPRVVRHLQLGLCFSGLDAVETRQAELVFSQHVKTMLRSERLGQIDALDPAVAAEVLRRASLQPEAQPAQMRGEVAMVTGAASGIGKACVESFLARGAAVVGLDINPAIVTMMDRPDFLGISCDISNEEAVRMAVERTAQTFGGLDMLVLNAGVFPSGCRIESLKMADWDRVMRINLDANLTILRETYPLLKYSPRSGRVVVNASRNALAPGPGAAAYSVSKMALTQLARVAALEWGGDQIRINIIHPDAVFDTGVWAGDVLKARAEHYGMTVDQYKRRNVLKTELSSHYVSELVVEMCGPLFEKITGAQIPVDGGSDRVI